VGKRSVIGAPGDAAVEALGESGHLVVESFAEDVFEAADRVARHPGLVVLSITPFGRTGPYAGRGDGVHRWLRRPAPTLGEHNREILSERLGLSGSELDELESARVIGTLPTGL
jgi:crotonobetainyl-CoA:carnitine CoA-transferase CaiB-like acyl-CoA transferase